MGFIPKKRKCSYIDKAPAGYFCLIWSWTTSACW